MGVGISSRYRGIDVYDATDAAGGRHPTVAIRRHVGTDPEAPRYHHRMTGVENIEYLGWRLSGSSELWWRIADENPVTFPLDLHAGDAVTLAAVAPEESITPRERVF